MNHQRPVSLYIVVPLAHKNSLKPVIRLMLGQSLIGLPNTWIRNGRAVTGYRHRLLLMIDEFPSSGGSTYLRSPVVGRRLWHQGLPDART